ncbi:hypothetical protein CXF72_09990 [Psychromonas sp. MB-3u-54]|nr:hypothetical protein CXF72_09990 [Psychromonas sp. MB-3u-54]
MNLGKGFIDYYFNKMFERLFNKQTVLNIDYLNRNLLFCVSLNLYFPSLFLYLRIVLLYILSAGGFSLKWVKRKELELMPFELLTRRAPS